MTETGDSYAFAYIHSDIPEGMTIGAWRAQRLAETIARRDAARTDRRLRRARRIRRLVEVLHWLVPRRRAQSRKAYG
jgi:hypothetical protein